MADTTTVNLPKKHRARYPDQCVVCSCSAPGSTVRIAAEPIASYNLWRWLLGMGLTVKAPACRGCGWRLHRRWIGDLLMTFALIGGAIWISYPLLASRLSDGGVVIALLVIVVLGLVPWGIRQVLDPPAFDATAKGKSIDYEFLDRNLARAFATLNQNAKWVEVSGPGGTHETDAGSSDTSTKDAH